ncbi:hypothetical protein WJ96_04385 [Burkholderia ubonensis]|uniref:Uncharacterized protein n=1 Tax=Burkholderia ubonensis TaxID=101571 RepID=A0AAW3MV55_9BURK|nr:hypothetical protein [Burkholderia ubonensis]KVP65610.1 hypothetical protein WJ93_24120 [Burkholderia ubonensis]KVP96467.1 hypothetical protein WJ97_11295 [Burkholderia ubonensis]KVP97813.1 hypothetical protein WJ96_04385 [Burkholderia ubonensis]KVZ92510.1 hypothetical protein WL25_16040 [Burkholderia ubonensis]
MSELSNQLSGFEPEAVHYLGDEAEKEFQSCMECAYAHGATGGVYGYSWAVFGDKPFEQEVKPKLTPIARGADLNLNDFNMIVIDSGSVDGDSWKYLYHPAIKSGTFIQEA